MVVGLGGGGQNRFAGGENLCQKVSRESGESKDGDASPRFQMVCSSMFTAQTAVAISIGFESRYSVKYCVVFKHKIDKGDDQYYFLQASKDHAVTFN